MVEPVVIQTQPGMTDVVIVPLGAIGWTLRGEVARYLPPREPKRRNRPV